MIDEPAQVTIGKAPRAEQQPRAAAPHDARAEGAATASRLAAGRQMARTAAASWGPPRHGATQPQRPLPPARAAPIALAQRAVAWPRSKFPEILLEIRGS